MGEVESGEGPPLGRSGLGSNAWLVLLAGSPRSVGFEPVRDTLLSVPGVRATHELHLWSLTLTYHVASAHLAIGESTLALASYLLEIFPPHPAPTTALAPFPFHTWKDGLNSISLS